MKSKHHYYTYMLIVLAAGFIMLIGQALDAAVTLEPGKDPSLQARSTCNSLISQQLTYNENAINKYLCCEAACQANCGNGVLCTSTCLPACTS